MPPQEKIRQIKALIQRVNKNMHSFFRIYDQVFQMNTYGYDLFVNLDMTTEEIYHDLTILSIEAGFEPSILPEPIQKKWNHIMNSKKRSAEDFKDENFDAFFWSYILVEIYIVLPYFLMHYRIQMQLAKHPNWDEYKAKQRLAWTTSPLDLYATNQIFKQWDSIDQRATKIATDVSEKPALCHVSYEELAQTFSRAFNYYYLVFEDDLITRTILRNIYFGQKAPWFVATVVVALILGFGLGFGLHLHGN